MSAEEFMENFIIGLDDLIYEMLMYVETEKFEEASVIRDEIEKVIVKTKKVIINKGWTKFNDVDLEDFLRDIRDNILFIWEESIITNNDRKIFKQRDYNII
jgi:hypothetical protein